MTTVINNPNGESGDQLGSGFIIGLVIAILLIILFIIYGLPALRSVDDGGNTTIIEGDEPDTNINLDPNPDIIINSSDSDNNISTSTN